MKIWMKTSMLMVLLMTLVLAGCGNKQQKNEQQQTANNSQADQEVVAIIAPMKEELAKFKKDMKVENTEKIASLKFYEGTLKGQNIVVVRSGIGKVNAAMAAQIMISDFDADYLINTGIAGAIKEKLELGDVVIATETVQHDMDETAKGLEPGVIPRMETSVWKTDKQLIKLAEQAAKKLPEKVEVYKGRIATGDQFIASEEKKQWIAKHFHPYAVEMEGGAIGQVAYLNDVPYIVIRSISDDAGEHAMVKWDRFVKKAANRAATVVEGMLAHME